MKTDKSGADLVSPAAGPQVVAVDEQSDRVDVARKERLQLIDQHPDEELLHTFPASGPEPTRHDLAPMPDAPPSTDARLVQNRQVKAEGNDDKPGGTQGWLATLISILASISGIRSTRGFEEDLTRGSWKRYLIVLVALMVIYVLLHVLFVKALIAYYQK